MQIGPHTFLTLSNVVVSGLDEALARALCETCGFRRLEGFESSVSTERALFRLDAQQASPTDGGRASCDQGRYLSVVKGELFLEDGSTSVLQDMVLKIPRAPIDALGLVAAEGERLAQISGFHVSIPRPLGCAMADADEVASAGCSDFHLESFEGRGTVSMLCGLQAAVPGETLRDLLYQNVAGEAALVPDRRKIREFLGRFSPNEPWLRSDGDEVPLYPLLTSFAIPLLDDLSRIEGEGWQHCDVSPNNVMVSDDGQAPVFHLVDFALLARADDPPHGCGTRPYAPAWLEGQGRAVKCKGLDARAVCAVTWELAGLSARHPADPFGVSYPSESVAVAVANRLAGADVTHDIREDGGKLLSVRDEVAQFDRRVLLALQSVLMAGRDELSCTAEQACAAIRHEVDALPDRLRSICMNQHRELRNRVSENALCVIFGVIVVMIFTVSEPNSLLSILLDNILPFSLISVGMAVLPTALGLLVDAPVAWARYQRAQRARGTSAHPFSWSVFKRVAKYGDPTCVAAGKGMFDPSFEAASYYCLCNVLGSLCVIALACTVLSLPGVGSCVAALPYMRIVWGIGLFVSGVSAFKTTVSMQELPWLPFQDEARENPDNSLFTRAHIGANVVHLMWTFTWVVVLTFVLLSCGLENWGSSGLPWRFLLVEAAVAVFLAYSGLSKRARSIEAEAVSSLSSGLAAVAVASIAFAWIVFPPTPQNMPSSVLASVAATILAASYLAFTRAWRKRVREDTKTRIWVRRYARGTAFAPLIAIGVLCAAIACIIATTMAI